MEVPECECDGIYLGHGTGCDPNFCILPPGACCLADGGCIQVPECACDGIWYVGDCSPNPCGTPVEKTSWGGIKYRYRGR